MAGIAAGAGIGSTASCAVDSRCVQLEGRPESVCTAPGGLLRKFSQDAESSDTPPFARAGGEAARNWCSNTLQSGSDLT